MLKELLKVKKFIKKYKYLLKEVYKFVKIIYVGFILDVLGFYSFIV